MPAESETTSVLESKIVQDLLSFPKAKCQGTSPAHCPLPG